MSTIEVAVVGRGIQVKQGYEKPSAGDVNTCEVSLAIESGGVWDSLPHKRVTFSTRTASVTVDYAPTIAIPHEVMASPGALYITLTGYDANGIEVARTHRMTYPIEVARAGADEGAEPTPATLDVVSRIDNLASTLEASETTRQEAFESAQNERSSAFQASMSEWQQDVAESVSQVSTAIETANNAASAANEASDNANETANTIKQRADSGEFNGEPGADGYSPTATVTKDGGTATITVTDKNGTTTAIVSDGPAGKDGSDASATDVRINGTSITVDGVADIPLASGTNVGVVKTDNSYGSYSTGLVMASDRLYLKNANTVEITERAHRIPILANNLDFAVKAAMCDGNGPKWTDAEKLAARERLGIGGNIDVTTLTFEEPVNNAELTFQTPKPYSTVIVQFSIPEIPGDTNGRACPMYLDVSKQDGSGEMALYTWIGMPPLANGPFNFVGLLSNDNGLWTWQVKGPTNSKYYDNTAWTIQLPSYRNPADFIVKERPYVKKIIIGWVSSAFPAGSSITAYGVL